MRKQDLIGRKPWAAAGAAVALVLGTNGCGGDEFANDQREPTPITLSASITPRDVTVSPSRLGAGAIELIASNLTGTSQQVTLSSRSLAGGGERLEQRTGPINPGDTASLTADLAQGTYSVSTGSRAITRATIRVGPRRESAQDELVQP